MFDTLTVPVCGCDRPEQVNTLMPVDETVRSIHALVQPMRRTELGNVGEAAGRTMAKSAHAPRPMPFFNNSAMDGFAIRTADLVGSGPWILPIMGPIAAGASASLELPVSPIALRIFTGAPVPAGFDAVIMQEDVDFDAEKARFMDRSRPGQNVRAAGEDIRRGTLACWQPTVIPQ
jgi:molybdopterin molybdotransferase